MEQDSCDGWQNTCNLSEEHHKKEKKNHLRIRTRPPHHPYFQKCLFLLLLSTPWNTNQTYFSFIFDGAPAKEVKSETLLSN